MLELFDLTWFEELSGEISKSCAAYPPPLHAIRQRERIHPYGFRRMLELRSADILMPDLQRVGGVSEFMRVGTWRKPRRAGIEPSVSGDQRPGARRARERHLS